MTDLFSPFQLGNLTLSNRIVMAPLTRARAPQDVATERIALYYAQRSTAGLIVSEGTPISNEGQGYLFNPGIFTREQIEGWRLTTQSVHAVGGKIFAQLWHVGRVSHTSIQAGGRPPVSPSAKRAVGAMAFAYKEDGSTDFVEASQPRALATDEVARVAAEFAQAAVNAIDAGFDGVEIHGANGYLIDQFINPGVNDRADQYGGQTVRSRIQFALEVVDAVVTKVGKERVGIRLSPYGQAFDTPLYADIDETYQALVGELGNRSIAYVHIMDHPRGGPEAKAHTEMARFDRLLTDFKPLLPNTALILAGGLTRERAESLVSSGVIDLAAFGRAFISNPDLVARLRNGWPLNEGDRSTYYGGGAVGFIDYAPHPQTN